MLLSNDAWAIIGGNESATCDWPSVVILQARDDSICTGVYIGGRIVLTAAHCDDGNGLYYNHDEIHEYTGVLPAPSLCESDAECPSVEIDGQLIAMECDDEFGEHPSPEGSCYLPDETFHYSNFALEVSFGEAYPQHGTEQPYNSIPIQYCKVFDEAEGSGFDPDDFAYCILAQEPDVEPVPIMMHCEVDEFLDGSYDLDLVAVGFGDATNEMEGEQANADKSGRKRWASTELGRLGPSADRFLSRLKRGAASGLAARWRATTRT